jgi:hypothetical protein
MAAGFGLHASDVVSRSNGRQEKDERKIKGECFFLLQFLSFKVSKMGIPF